MEGRSEQDTESRPGPRLERRGGPPLRAHDLEPHEGLRYIARLFKLLALLLLLLLVAEVVIGLVQVGMTAIPTLMVEATRLAVFAGFLWAAGDLVLMLIESNHDLRKLRVLVSRLEARVQRLPESDAATGPPDTGP
jgi:hypothetical protein